MRVDGSGVTLKEERTKGASTLSGVGLVDWSTVGGGVNSAVLVVEDVLRRHGGEMKEEKGDPFFIYTRDGDDNRPKAIGRRQRHVKTPPITLWST